LHAQKALAPAFFEARKKSFFFFSPYGFPLLASRSGHFFWVPVPSHVMPTASAVPFFELLVGGIQTPPCFHFGEASFSVFFFCIVGRKYYKVSPFFFPRLLPLISVVVSPLLPGNPEIVTATPPPFFGWGSGLAKESYPSPFPLTGDRGS